MTRQVDMGTWFSTRRGEILNSGRNQYSVDGLQHRLTITGVDDLDEATFYYSTNVGYFSGIVTVVEGGDRYGEWSQWQESSCSVSCGTGTQTESRSRSCISGSCTGLLAETRAINTCSRQICDQYGEWSQWQESSCSVSCGTGTQTESRSRSCISGSCTGLLVETRAINTCNRSPCGATYSQWTNWQDSSSCSQTCGRGERVQRRTRNCLSGTCTDLQQTRESECFVTTCPDATYSQWTSWQDISSCSQTCGRGEKVQRRTRNCLSGNCADLQQTRETECFVTTCPGDPSGLCSSAVLRNGVSYRYSPTDCDKYIQCYTQNGVTIAVQRMCPLGYFWDRDLFSCQPAYTVNCPLDKCESDCPTSYKVPGSCGSYIQCVKGKAWPMCCPRGFMYVQGKGCRFNMECDGFCPNPWIQSSTCWNMQSVDNDPTKFRLFAGDFGWQTTSCPSGSVFDLLRCDCVTIKGDTCTPVYDMSFTQQQSISLTNVQLSGDRASFQRNSRLMLDVETLERTYPVGMKMRFRETAVNSDWRMLMTSESCNGRPNFVMAMDDDNQLHFHLTTWYGDTSILTLSTQGMEGWKTVTLGYDGYTLRATVESGGLMNEALLQGQDSDGMTGVLECGIVLGASDDTTGDNGFIGDVNMFQLFNCDPTMIYIPRK